jgi:hypothetical protein
MRRIPCASPCREDMTMPSHDDFVGSHDDPEERTKPDSFDRLRPETLTANDRSAPSRRRTPRRISFGCEAVLGFAEYALDYNLSGVRRGLSRVLMAALGAPDPHRARPADRLCLRHFRLSGARRRMDRGARCNRRVPCRRTQGLLHHHGPRAQRRPSHRPRRGRSGAPAHVCPPVETSD